MPESEAIRLLVIGITSPVETFLVRILAGLADAGVRVTVASAKRPGHGELRDASIDWVHAPAWQGSLMRRMGRLARMAVRARIVDGRATRLLSEACDDGASRVQRWRGLHRVLPFVGRTWDVIYSPWNSAAIDHQPLFRLGTPVVVSCRGSQINIAPHNPRRAAIQEGLRETFSRAAAVHCVSESIERQAMQYGLNPAKSTIIRPAVDEDFFCPQATHQTAEGTLRVVTTGSYIWCKGYEYALGAIQRLVTRQVPVHFDIIGDGPERQRVLYTIHDLGLQDHVSLLGRMAPEQVRDRLQASHVFVLSSLSEGISNAALEAMACGLPIVTTDCGGMREAVTDGVEGFVVPPRDPVSMAEALERLFREEGLCQRMGRAGRERIERQFRLSDQIGQYRGLFESVARSSMAQRTRAMTPSANGQASRNSVAAELHT